MQDYQSKRDYIIKLLTGVGFKIRFIPQGSFFLFAELPENCPLSDVWALFTLFYKIRSYLWLSQSILVEIFFFFKCCFKAVNVFLLQVEFVKELILEAGVVAVPGQGFFHTNLSSNEVSNESCNYQQRYIRFAFCKSDTTLSMVSERLGKLLDAAGHLRFFLRAAIMKDTWNPLYLHYSNALDLVLVSHPLNGSNCNTWSLAVIVASSIKSKVAFIDKAIWFWSQPLNA